jgi:choline dehydrogenase
MRAHPPNGDPNRMAAMTETYDYIIVGSGAGGSTLAYRLAQAGLGTVLVIEHGPDDRNPMHRVPKGFTFTLKGDRYAYHYPTEAISGTDAHETWTRGKVVGGSTTVNTMIYSRGSQLDFEALAAHARADHWGWERVLAAYRAMEDHALGASAMRGAGGRLGVSAQGAGGELVDRAFAAAGEIGWRRVLDINDGDDERIGFTPSTIRSGRRTNAASAFLHPAVRDGGVRLVTRTRVSKILIRGGRAIGVEALHGGAAVEFRARREVIVAGGTIESPLLLERSGIGRPGVLERLGVSVIVESPHVGERVIEHRVVTVQVRLNRRLGLTERLNRPVEQGVEMLGYLITRRGLMASSGFDLAFHHKSDPSLARPDLVGGMSQTAIDPAGDGYKLADHPGMLLWTYQKRPETTGSVHASGTEPAAPPVISPRYFETPTDAAAAGRIVGRIREYTAASPLAEVIDGEDFPTSAVSDDPESALEYARRSGTASAHAVGSCALGPEDDDVVDAQLRVRGVEGLRVVDASVLPFHVSGNTAAPVMAVAWIAGDLVAGEIGRHHPAFARTAA